MLGCRRQTHKGGALERIRLLYREMNDKLIAIVAVLVVDVC